jgi:hypothetical protein
VLSHALCLAGLLAAAATPGDPREAARDVLARGRYQTDLPGASRPSGQSPADDAPTGRRPSRPRAPSGATVPSIPLPPAALVWALLAALVLIALAWAAHLAVRARRGADAEPAPLPVETKPSPPRALRIGPLTDVEDLARAGRYGDAIHLLLLHLFAALQRRPATAPAPAHTSREVLSRTRLASEAHAALGVLVQAAEAVHFGGREAGRADYENCLGHYRRFLASFERAS